MILDREPRREPLQESKLTQAIKAVKADCETVKGQLRQATVNLPNPSPKPLDTPPTGLIPKPARRNSPGSADDQPADLNVKRDSQPAEPEFLKMFKSNLKKLKNISPTSPINEGDIQGPGPPWTQPSAQTHNIPSCPTNRDDINGSGLTWTAPTHDNTSGDQDKPSATQATGSQATFLLEATYNPSSCHSPQLPHKPSNEEKPTE